MSEELQAVRNERDFYRAQRDRWKTEAQAALQREGEADRRVSYLENKVAVYKALCADYRSLVLERDEYGDEMRLLQRRVIFLEGVIAAKAVDD